MTGPEQTAPERIGAYRIEGMLGSGGMGVVYRARMDDGTAVALKTLHDGFSPETLARFLREGLVRVEHDNVVRVLESGMAGRHPFIALELLTGESLHDRLKREPVAEPAALVAILVQACAGVAALHGSGIIHRDLKPANIFLGEDGTVKVLDFGVAQLADSSKLTVTGTVLGTPAYLSPEQARGQREVDPRADIWALGAIAYRALTGRGPFDRGSAYATLVAILFDELVPIRAHAPHVPPALAEIVERCLEKDADARLASATELGALLRDVDLREGSAGAPAPPMPAGEERLVVVLLAQGVTDRTDVEAVVSAHGGAPVRLIGGDLIGVFGARRTEGDEAARAVRAALASRHLANRVSIGSGRARSSGGTLAGTAVEAAERGSRHEVLGVVVDADTAALLSGRFTIDPLGEELCEVVAERFDEGGGDAGPLPPFVGRDVELARIRAELRAAAAGAARLCLVTGPPGAGKTRLCREGEREASSSFRTLAGAADPLHRERALALFADAVRQRARILARKGGGPRIDTHAPPAEQRQAVARVAREALPGAAAEARDVAQFLGVLCGLAMPDNDALRAAQDDPQLMADRLRLAIGDWLAGLCAQGPVLLVLEDLHWADPASLRLAHDLLDRLAGMPLCVIATARADEASGITLAGRTGATRIALAGLSRQHGAELAEAIAGRPLPEPVVTAILRATDGNPLFVEQIARSLGDDMSADESVPLPLTVEAAIQARLDHLPADEKELCKLGSILGRPFRTAELQALGAIEPELLVASLRERAILEPASGNAFGFRSSLTAEVAYRSMAPEVRRDLHGKAAAFLAFRSTMVEPEEVARHFDRGGRPESAAEFYARAALAAAGRGDAAALVRCADRAFELGAPPEMRFELHMASADAHRFLGDKRRWADEVEHALGAARGEEERARALTEKSGWLARAGRLDEALVAAEQAAAAAREVTRGAPLVFALVRQAEALMFSHRGDEAVPVLDEAQSLVESGADRAAAKVAAARANLAVAMGDPGAARAAYERAIALHRASGDLRRAVMNEQNLAEIHNRVGAYAEAERALADALVAARRAGNRLGEGYVLVNLGYAQARRARLAEALESLAQASTVAQQTGDVRLGLAARLYRSRALLADGKPDAALAEAQAAAGEAEASGAAWLLALARTAVARALVGLGRSEEAVDAAAAALGIRDSLGAIEEDEAEIFATCADALDAAGRAPEASQVRARGRARVEELAARIRDPVWRRRFRDDVEAHRLLLSDDA